MENRIETSTDHFTKDELDWWAKFYASQQVGEESSYSSWVVFHLGEELFCVPLEDLSEIAKPELGVGLSHVPQNILGLMNLRGDAILLVDMGQLLGVSRARTPDPHQRVLLFSDRHGLRTGFLVDRIEAIVPFDPRAFQEISTVEGDKGSRFIAAVGEHNGKGISQIDVQAILGSIK